MCGEQLYKNASYRTTIINMFEDIIWREKNIDDEVERFRKNYQRWCENYPGRVKYTRGKNHRAMTADDYIGDFRRHINAIIEEADRLRWPWEWCIDDQSDRGKYFCPKWVILGDSRIFDISEEELREVPFSRQRVKGDRAKRSTVLNDRYKRCNSFYGSNTSIAKENFVCNYFRKRPVVDEGTVIESGHIYAFDKDKSSIFNNNMLNVKWQVRHDNRSFQKLFENGKNEEVFKKESEKTGLKIEIPSDLQAMLDSVKDPTLDVAIEFCRNENGIYRIIPRMSRGIVPVDEKD